MAYRNRDDRFRPRRNEDDFNYNLHQGSQSGGEGDYPLSDADRERFAREDITQRDFHDGDVDRHRYGRDVSETRRTYSRFNEERPSQGARQGGPGRDWRDTFYPRGTMSESRDGFSGGGYTDDVGGSGMMNSPRSNRGRGQTDYWEPHVDNARPFFTGAHSGQVPERNIGFGGAGHAADHLYDNHHHDSEYLRWRHSQLSSHDRDYHNWRTEQAQNYDTSYENWRRSRSDKFAKEFDDWRTSQESASQSGNANRTPSANTSAGMAGSTGAAYGAGADRTGHSAQASQGHRNAATANPPASGASASSTATSPTGGSTGTSSTPR